MLFNPDPSDDFDGRPEPFFFWVYSNHQNRFPLFVFSMLGSLFEFAFLFFFYQPSLSSFFFTASTDFSFLSHLDVSAFFLDRLLFAISSLVDTARQATQRR